MSKVIRKTKGNREVIKMEEMKQRKNTERKMSEQTVWTEG